MPFRPASPLDRLAERRMLRRWSGAAEAAGDADLESLRALRQSARRMRRTLDRVLAVAEGRLALPMIGSNAMNRPPGADWIWRPDYWREPVEPRGHAGVGSRTDLGGGLALFHDCPMREAAVRQDRNGGAGVLAPYALVLEVLGFGGSFLSLALDLPASAAEGLKRRHVLRAEFEVAAERPLGALARLNVKHGPNTEQITAPVHLATGEAVAEFDLAYARVDENRVEKIWLDLILNDPAMNALRIGDLRMSRRLRAEL